MNQVMQLPKVSNADLERRVNLMIAEILDVDESTIHPSSRFREDLGADSLDLVSIIMAFRTIFKAKICDREVLHIQTVGEAITYLEEHPSP